tara:strand:- start:4568 stop:5866 length:1299 start_codon:yes stop_codon:yes gene_type:complete
MHLSALGDWIEVAWHPFAWFSLYFFYQVTLRAILHAFGWAVPLAEFGYDYIYIHIFASCFYLVFALCSLRFTKNIPRQFWAKQSRVVEGCEYWLLFILFGLYACSWVVMYKYGAFATLGDNRVYQYSYIRTIANFIFGFAPFIVGLAGLLMLRDRRITMFVVVLLMACFMMLPSLIGGGRAALLGVFIMFGLLLFRTKGMFKYVAVLSALVLVVFAGLVVTALRGSHFYQKEQVSEDVKYALSAQMGEVSYAAGDALLSGLDRFSYYSDTWVMLKRKRWNGEGGVPKGIYPLGSITDLYMFVPRPIWPGKPYGRFNYWMGFVLLGRTHDLDYPIGRIGEAYYVADFAGILFAPIYAFLFVSIIYRRLYFSSRLVGVAFYFYFLFRYIIGGGGNFMAFVDVTLKSAILIYLCYFVLRLVFRRSSVTQRTLSST